MDNQVASGIGLLGLHKRVVDNIREQRLERLTGLVRPSLGTADYRPHCGQPEERAAHGQKARRSGKRTEEMRRRKRMRG